jgi:two-component system, cell cycle response regulator
MDIKPTVQNQTINQGKTILVVDDSLTIRMQVKDLLEENNFKVILAENGEKCLEILETLIPYAILLDIIMPGIDGVEVCKKIKGDAKYESIPIIMLTAQGNTENKVKGLNAGADDYLTKPFEIEELLARLKAVLRTKTLYEELKSANHKIMEQQKSVIEEERLKVLLQMAGATAHELNQPLMILLGNIELMHVSMDEPEALAECMSEVAKAGNRIADIIKKIKTVRDVEVKPYLGKSKIINLHQKVKILSVEDTNEDFQKISDILKPHDQISLSRAISVEECILELEQNKYDLILLDHLLPDGDGFDCLDNIGKKWASIPVILCTGHGDEVLASQAIQSGASDYIPKAMLSDTSLLRAIENALEKARLKTEIRLAKEKMVEMSIKDELTDLYNRRYFMEAVKSEVTRARRYKTELVFCMMDIDYFKKVNDTYGHFAGDAVLKDMGKILKDSIRQTDLICRYGGEEFGIILTCINREEARNVCEKFREKVSLHRTKYDSIGIKVTISIGMACYDPANHVTHNTLIENADKALYQAKNSGRNQVKIYQE